MDADVETLVRLAIEQLRDGRAADALLTLERTVDPKFGSAEFARAQYEMFDSAGNASPLRDHMAASVAIVAA